VVAADIASQSVVAQSISNGSRVKFVRRILALGWLGRAEGMPVSKRSPATLESMRREGSRLSLRKLCLSRPVLSPPRLKVHFLVTATDGDLT